MEPLDRGDRAAGAGRDPGRGGDTDPAVRPGTDPAGSGIKAAVAAASVPPLSGGPGSHSSEAAHTFTIAGKGTRTVLVDLTQPRSGPAACVGSTETGQSDRRISRRRRRPRSSLFAAGASGRGR